MSLKQSLVRQKKADEFRGWFKCILQANRPDGIHLHEFPKWDIWSGDECLTGSWDYGQMENMIAYSILKKSYF